MFIDFSIIFILVMGIAAASKAPTRDRKAGALVISILGAVWIAYYAKYYMGVDTPIVDYLSFMSTLILIIIPTAAVLALVSTSVIRSIVSWISSLIKLIRGRGRKQTRIMH